MKLRFAVPLVLLAVVAPATAGAKTLSDKDFSTLKLAGASSGTEPRIAVDHNDNRWAVTNGGGGAIVYKSTDTGESFDKVPGTWTQALATIDVDIVAMNLGQAMPRILASELDTAGLNFPTGYTDDGGKTWHDSRGSVVLADQDRQWFAVGPNDPLTGKPHVYLLYHNLGSGLATHNMWVATSIDGGETFGAPVPVAIPGSDAWTDLQCADSGGPSNITVNQKTGQIYVFFTTRAYSPAPGVDTGGCGSSAFQPPLEFNIVNGTRVWVATSPNGLPGTWKDTLAVDDSATGQVVSMQLAYGALDTKGGVYVAYPESPKPYPDLTGSAVKLVWQDPDASGNLDPTAWSKPVTLVAPEDGQNGANLVHLVVGDPGKVAVGYYKAEGGGPNNSPAPYWFTHVLQSLDVRSVDPHVTDVKVSDVAAYKWTASQMMGICAAAGPTQGIQNGLTCSRSTDVWGIALDKECRVSVVWPTGHGGATGNKAGTYVTTQTDGPTLCGDDSGTS
jgi:hypothetical protein